MYGLLSEDCKKGWKAGSFHSVKSKEQGRENQKISDCPGPHSLSCLGWESQSRVGDSGVTGWRHTAFWSGGAFTGTWKFSKLWLADMAPWAGVTPSWA